MTILVAFLIAIILFLAFLIAVPDDNIAPIACGLLIVWVVFIALTAIAPSDYTTHRLNINTVDKIDFVIVNNKLVNLNTIFGRDFAEGDTIDLKLSTTKTQVVFFRPHMYITHDNQTQLVYDR